MYVAASLLMVGACFTSCSDDDEASYSGSAVTNTQLKTILTQKGCQFNEQGNLLLDGVAQGITSLDLSGTKMTDFSELTILPNLTEVDLSDNNYEMSFDFSKLPEQITAVDLTGNEIYEFPGLVNIVTAENGEETVTVLHKLTKFSLPESAKYNCDEIPAYFAKNTEADMKMANASGSLEAYNTLREVPDEGFRTILKSTFPSMFNGDKIDISKRLVSTSEVTQGISTYNPDAQTETVDNVEGFQYIVDNKGFQGSSLHLQTNETCTISYFPVSSNINDILLLHISTPNGIDLSHARNFSYLDMEYNPTIETLDFTGSTAFGQRGDKAEYVGQSTPSSLVALSCESLTDITFPALAKVAQTIELVNCPKMQKVDLSQFETMYRLRFGLMPTSCEITYLSPKRLLNDANMLFGIDDAMYNRTDTKAFLDTYHKQLQYTGLSRGHGTKACNWTRYYQ